MELINQGTRLFLLSLPHAQIKVSWSIFSGRYIAGHNNGRVLEIISLFVMLSLELKTNEFACIYNIYIFVIKVPDTLICIRLVASAAFR